MDVRRVGGPWVLAEQKEQRPETTEAASSKRNPKIYVRLIVYIKLALRAAPQVHVSK